MKTSTSLSIRGQVYPIGLVPVRLAGVDLGNERLNERENRSKSGVKLVLGRIVVCKILAVIQW